MRQVWMPLSVEGQHPVVHCQAQASSVKGGEWYCAQRCSRFVQSVWVSIEL